MLGPGLGMEYRVSNPSRSIPIPPVQTCLSHLVLLCTVCKIGSFASFLPPSLGQFSFAGLEILSFFLQVLKFRSSPNRRLFHFFFVLCVSLAVFFPRNPSLNELCSYTNAWIWQ